jgi:hypothetical protein
MYVVFKERFWVAFIFLPGRCVAAHLINAFAQNYVLDGNDFLHGHHPSFLDNSSFCQPSSSSIL